MGLETLRSLLTPAALLRLAGDVTHARGLGYAREGRVAGIAEGPVELSATVTGTQTYRVRLWDDGGALGFDCSCPVGVDLRFCKHCVAVALTWNSPAEKATPAPAAAEDVGRAPRRDGREGVRAFLRSLEHEALVELMMEQAGASPALRSRLKLRAASAAGALDVKRFRSAIDSAFRTGPFVDYERAGSYASRIGDVIEALRGLLDPAPDALIELTEYALERAERAIQNVDDSDGYFTGIFAELSELHLQACERARPLPAPLAARLFRRELDSGYGIFHRAALTYAHVLGREGLQAYRILAEREWRTVPELRPGAERDDFSRRFRITEMMDALAEAEGDLEGRVEVRRRDLSSPYGFLQIARLYADAGRPEQAIEWAERGLAAFPERPDGRLRQFLAAEYQRAGRHADALAMLWADYTADPRLESYRRLKEHADPRGEWAEWRQRALALVRELADAAASAAAQRPPGWRIEPRGYSEVVRFLLWEDAVDEAWSAARQGGCTDEVWFELARRREQAHPADAIPIYQRRIEAEVSHASNRGYEAAVRLLPRLKSLFQRAGADAEAFAAFVARLRDAHRRKRNFIALLDRARLS